MISFLIVNYKVGPLVHQTIQYIQENVTTPYEIIVYDNHSDDGSVESLKGVYRNTKVISSDENLGFGAGNNEAYKFASGNFIFLLNPDTIIFDDSVDRMITYMVNNPKVGMTSPTLLYEDGSLQRSIRRFYSFYGSLIDNRFMNPVISKIPQLTKLLPGLVNHYESQEIEWAKGAALLLRREVIEDIGLFDTDFWIYGEEMDLCFRIGEAGWKKVFLSSCSIIHLEGKSTIQSSTKMFLMNYKGMYLFLKKHFSIKTLKAYHTRVWLFSRLIYLISFNNRDKKAMYKSLIHWHKSEGKKLIPS
ncbi:MAG: hypothetical protein BalsKO_13940 [Balneolaceae bacterium]